MNSNIIGSAFGKDNRKYNLEMGDGCYCSRCCFHRDDDTLCDSRLYKAFGTASCKSVALLKFDVDVKEEICYCYTLCNNKSHILNSWKELGGNNDKDKRK